MKKFVIGQVDISNLAHIIDEAIEQNANLISMTIENSSESVSTILNAYIDRLLALMLRDYDKERLLEVISSGVIFTLRSVLEDKLNSNQMIMKAISDQQSLAV
ncbi:MAG TPA: hypothetical protein VEY70_07720 [Metabacillus sp.]|nr:hypothetical protein [Metabacillus sp.]